jgi:hypothetical protein
MRANIPLVLASRYNYAAIPDGFRRVLCWSAIALDRRCPVYAQQHEARDGEVQTRVC